MENEIYKSAMKSDKSIGVFFEDDGDTGYFYLFDPRAAGGEKILSAIQIYKKRPNINSRDINIIWDKSETKIAVAIKNKIRGIFDIISNMNYSYNRQEGVISPIPSEILNSFIFQEKNNKSCRPNTKFAR